MKDDGVIVSEPVVMTAPPRIAWVSHLNLIAMIGRGREQKKSKSRHRQLLQAARSVCSLPTRRGSGQGLHSVAKPDDTMIDDVNAY